MPNFLDNQEIKEVKKDIRKKPKLLMKGAAFLLTFLFIAFFIFTTQVIVSNQKPSSWMARIPIINTLKNLAESADKALKGEQRERVNILLLGMGGRQHEGGYLTDTIILASLDLDTKKVAMMSIPRDMAIPIEDKGFQKINSINAYAEMDTADSGGLAVSQAVSDILGIPIDYYLRVDFEGFVNIINELDGLKVYVENTLEDHRYPVKGMESAENYEARFEHLYIEEGWQQLDGELALKFARSRHAYGVEGSDFARARRQQIIIEAVKNKLVSAHTLFNPSMIGDILEEANNHISTNLKTWEMVKLWKDFKDVSKDQIINKVLDNSPNGLLVDTIADTGAYILSPRSGDFSEIQYMVNNIFSDAPVEAKNVVVEEAATVEVRNGTWINGLASQASLDLEKYSFNVIRVGNSSKQNFQKSVIYDLSYGEKEESLAVLKKVLNANVSFGLPDWLVEDLEKDLENEKNPVQPDFLVILGQSADETLSGTENKEE
ncbi:MAG: LCP family protein [Patescibacteria group bacterium]|jgi:LCP family protein required for cell wall assembly|nr:LCP family protein [Patescibacteria group bacterium]